MANANRIRLYSAVLLTVLFVGCAAPGPRQPQPQQQPQQQPPQQQPQRVNLSGYSETFRQGYAEGCESAGSRSQRRNENRYKTEADYMMGWNDGFSTCRKGR